MNKRTHLNHWFLRPSQTYAVIIDTSQQRHLEILKKSLCMIIYLTELFPLDKLFFVKYEILFSVNVNFLYGCLSPWTK